MRLTIKEWPAHDRPRERMRQLGPRALSPRELLALLIETGTPPMNGKPGRSAMDLAGDLIAHFRDGENQSLRRIMTASVSDLCRVPGIGPAKAAKILAGLDLGRRAAEEVRPDRDRLQTARDVYERMRLTLRDLSQEEFHVLLLTTQNELIRDIQLTVGTLNATLVHPREVFRQAIAESAASLVLVHNHPSGEPWPSPDDRMVTMQLASAGETIGIPVVDHIIVGEGRYYSFVEEGVMP